MKRILRNSAIGIIALAVTVTAAPAQGQSWGRNNAGAWRGGAPEQQTSRAYDHGRYYRGRDYDDHGRADDRGRAYVVPGYTYYDNGGYGYSETRDGRSAAIIAGSAAAGALIGGAAGHGQGAVLGAVVGGIAGAIADQAVRHHDYR